MKCRCSETRERVAMLVGQDTVDPLPEEVRRSLANCPQCRDYYEEMKTSQAALEQFAGEDAGRLGHSLWPALQPRLQTKRPAVDRYETFKQRFVPAFSMTAACLAMLIVVWDTQTPSPRVYRTAASQGNDNWGATPVINVGSVGVNEATPANVGKSLWSDALVDSLPTGTAPEYDVNRPQNSASAEEAFLKLFRSEFERDLRRVR